MCKETLNLDDAFTQLTKGFDPLLKNVAADDDEGRAAAAIEELKERLKQSTRKVLEEYKSEENKIGGKPADDKQRKEFDKQAKLLAKALPGITKGTLAAITAFQKGDAITGSAAVMDICASIAPLLGVVSAAAGPPGMIVGAIFAMVGQILSFFAPKSESLTSQIAKLLRELRAEEIAQQIRAVHTNITNYASSLKQVNEKVDGRIEMAVDWPILQIMVIQRIIKDFNPIEGATTMRFWEVVEWLQEEKNQDLDEWPTILAAVCQAYIDLLVTVITLLSLLNTDSMRKRFDEAEALPEPGKRAVQHELTELLALGIARLIEFGACNDAQLRHLRRVATAAQNRGMLWYNGFGDHPLYAGTNIRKGRFEQLADESKRMAVAVSRKDMGKPNPLYHVFLLELRGKDRTYYKGISSPYKDAGLFQELKCNGSSLDGLTDIWATPGADHNDKADVLFYTAKDKEIRGFILNKENKVSHSGYTRVAKSKLVSVRVVHHPSSVEDDPDADSQVSRSTKTEYITYGGLEASREIYVDAAGKQGEVPSPWESYAGIGVDQHYLWVFGSAGFACATHASVMRCLYGKSQKPRWMTHWPEKHLYDESYHQHQRKVKNRAPLVGLVDICPCDDGTLVAAMYTRSAHPAGGIAEPDPRTYDPLEYSFRDTNAVYSVIYHPDLKNGTIEPVEWTKIGGKNLAVRVQKLPVFCWSLIESLTAMLEDLAPVLRGKS